LLAPDRAAANSRAIRAIARFPTADANWTWAPA
jgi:hypothetical protein